tara:strand:- start:681 stop:1349 length:669 start_codon:yes stop_codon:yes gene_type:complete
MNKEIRVFLSNRDGNCQDCGAEIRKSSMIAFTKKREVYCLSCADLDHLVYLPSGNAALTRRAKKHSTLSAVVYKWSSSRKRNERQGLLVEQRGLELAEKECLSDEDYRKARREKDKIRRAKLDQKYVTKFADEIRKFFPKSPKGLEKEIAEHACMKYSGRVGRSAFAKDLSKEAIILAVSAHIRHTKTNYDSLLAKYCDRDHARTIVSDDIEAILSKWQESS